MDAPGRRHYCHPSAVRPVIGLTFDDRANVSTTDCGRDHLCNGTIIIAVGATRDLYRVVTVAPLLGEGLTSGRALGQFCHEWNCRERSDHEITKLGNYVKFDCRLGNRNLF